jgi:DNA mismatch repair ATPase MutS
MITKHTGTSYTVKFPEPSEAQATIDGITDKAIEAVTKVFNQFVTERLLPLIGTIDDVSESLSQYDILLAFAYVSMKNHYTRPIVVTDGSIPFIRAKNMRHPIIEQQLKGIKYANFSLRKPF